MQTIEVWCNKHLIIRAKQRIIQTAAVTRHAFIEARMERGAERLLKLIAEGKLEEVQTIMETPTWGLEGLEEGASSCTL
jgi:predicted HAD superfamily phosphohydrolase